MALGLPIAGHMAGTGLNIKENTMLKRRIRTFAVTGITIVAAALITLSTTGAPAVSPAPTGAASHATDASATAAHPQGVLHVIRRGLVKDCEEIQLGNTDLQIWDEGPYRPVELLPAPGSCWNLHNTSYAWFGGKRYKGFQYQDLRGDCLWDYAGTITTAPGACQSGKSYQTFFGLNYYHNGHNSPGWIVTDALYGLSEHMDANYNPYVGEFVVMNPSNDNQDSHFWNFP